MTNTLTIRREWSGEIEGKSIDVYSLVTTYSLRRTFFISLYPLNMAGVLRGYWFDNQRRDIVRDKFSRPVLSALKIKQGTLL